MKNAVTLAAVLAAAPAAAQPAASTVAPQPTHPTCALTIARAPDDVRKVVETWVRAESRCTTALEVRIVPTEGGLYLLARDEHGRIRERVVPDAQSAGVLVASWVAADASDAPPPTEVREPPPPPPAAPEVAILDAPAAPSTMMPAAATAEPIATRAAVAPSLVVKPAAAPAPKWLALGGMFAMSGSGGGGVRAELDVKTWRSFTLGVAASFSTWGTTFYDHGERLETIDGKALAYLALDKQRGRWHFRGSVGAGAVYTHARVHEWTGGSHDAAGLFPAGEVAASVGRDVTDSWQLYAGPIFSVYGQTYTLEQTMQGNYASSQESRGIEAMFIFGMRHQL